MQTIDKIKEQIILKELMFFGSDEILDTYDIKNINQLTCAIIENYLTKKTSDFYEVNLESIDFRTNDGKYFRLDELSENDEKFSSFYYEIQTSDSFISILIDVDIKEYNPEEDYSCYIQDIFKTISRKTFATIEEFDPEERFDDLYIPYQGKSPRGLLYELDHAKDIFFDFADELKTT